MTELVTRVRGTIQNYEEKKMTSYYNKKNCEDCKRIKCVSGCICDCHPRHWW
jgi:hypothetical protein